MASPSPIQTILDGFVAIVSGPLGDQWFFPMGHPWDHMGKIPEKKIQSREIYMGSYQIRGTWGINQGVKRVGHPIFPGNKSLSKRERGFFSDL